MGHTFTVRRCYFLESCALCLQQRSWMLLYHWQQTQHNTTPTQTLLSVLQYLSNSCSRNSILIMFDIFIDSTAATSSSLGIDTNVLGATLGFPIIRLQRILSFSSTISEASLKLCKEILIILRKLLDLIRFPKEIFSRPYNSLYQTSHFFTYFSGTFCSTVILLNTVL